LLVFQLCVVSYCRLLCPPGRTLEFQQASAISKRLSMQFRVRLRDFHDVATLRGDVPPSSFSPFFTTIILTDCRVVLQQPRKRCLD
jgi:hypothetical protein